uniref:Uncharacterized protein n=1 Tax=Chrysopogon zizanioides TaxID=167337 RepID=A0A7T3V3R1_9POAL|nr:hypothetical protein KQ334_mgp066 [Chrysopogon zizanioides]YP_010131849.1 hypothetical protein KQ334_mgp026 [Chrysopogon zizanioides]QPZ94329.1 hypothetical protein [Chrysopogon zizanioides]QPZ94369.1 hypothetical protein [Chrysopogon zizanioides]
MSVLTGWLEKKSSLLDLRAQILLASWERVTGFLRLAYEDARRLINRKQMAGLLDGLTDRRELNDKVGMKNNARVGEDRSQNSRKGLPLSDGASSLSYRLGRSVDLVTTQYYYYIENGNDNGTRLRPFLYKIYPNIGRSYFAKQTIYTRAKTRQSNR